MVSEEEELRGIRVDDIKVEDTGVEAMTSHWSNVITVSMPNMPTTSHWMPIIQPSNVQTRKL